MSAANHNIIIVGLTQRRPQMRRSSALCGSIMTSGQQRLSELASIIR